MATRALLLVAALAACRGKAEPPQAAPPAPVAAPKPAVASDAADPWIVPDAAPETAAQRKARADAALARVAEILPKLAKLRHLSLVHPIPAEYQTSADFRAFVHREVDKERAKDEQLEAALVQLGLVPEPIDLAKAEEQAFATQAAAYYDPAQKKFFLVIVPDSPTILDAISAHELTHGLQDQHFNLSKYLAEDAHGVSTLDDDAQTARRFVVEGDATFAMFLYAVMDAMHTDQVSAANIGLVRGQLEAMANMDTAAMVDAMSAQTGIGEGEYAEAMKAMHDIPRTILVPMIDSYMKGALVALDAYENGGWPAVDALYKNPPESTAQVLHPKDKLLGKREHPHRVTLPKLAGYEQVTSNVLGELQWQVYFGLWKHQGDHPEQGWAGDRYAALRAPGGKLVVVIATAWDSEEAATQFASAYSSTIGDRVKAKAHTGQIAIKRVGTHVFVVDGADDPKLVDVLASGAKID